jgi:hypothetical protein
MIVRYAFLSVAFGLVCSVGLRAESPFRFGSPDGPSVTLSGYADAYFGFDSTGNGKRSGFLYNHVVQNRVATNLILLKADFQSERARAVVAAMHGDYRRYNLAAEPPGAKPWNEAYAGVKPWADFDFWIDAGIYASHIGIESAISADCPTLTRSIVAENSPYYSSGVRATYVSPDKKNEVAFHVLNGWQRIDFVEGINRPAFGLQLKHRFSDAVSANYSNFYGTVYPTAQDIYRHYHHVNLALVQGDWSYFGTFDIGFEAGKRWYSPMVMAQRKLTGTLSATARAEYYHDPDRANIGWGTGTGFSVTGFSVNLDYQVTKQVLLRVEPKIYRSADRDFDGHRTNAMLTGGVSVRF